MLIDHVAFVVASIETALEKLPDTGTAGPIEEFPAEGTRECYVGALLLLQPIADGPYASALQKRGPGLHHLGVKVPDLDAFLETLNGSGWYLHPRSFRTRAETSTIWLARPGVGALVEVHESKMGPQQTELESVRVNGLDDRTARLFTDPALLVVPGSPSAVKLGNTWLAFD